MFDSTVDLQLKHLERGVFFDKPFKYVKANTEFFQSAKMGIEFFEVARDTIILFGEQ